MLEIVLPFGLPPDELARDLLTSLRTPALAQLLARSSEESLVQYDGRQARLPHEIRLDQLLGPLATTPSAARLAAGLRADDITNGNWFMLHPVHLHIARDHLVLTDQRQLPLSETQAQALFAVAADLFQEAGLQLLYGDARCWFLPAPAWQDMQTCSLDAACGHNIDIWMPTGSAARAWRKLQNEVQMSWFEHPVNLARQTQGLPVVNSLWLQRMAAAGSAITETGKSLFCASSGTPSSANLDDPAPGGCASLPANAERGHQVLYADTLISPALSNDWSAWLDAFAALDAQWFAPLLADRSAWPLHLYLGNSLQLRHFICTRFAHLAFWRKHGLARLTP